MKRNERLQTANPAALSASSDESPCVVLHMNPHAHVDSIDVIKAFRTALFKFTESARSGLNDTDADIHRTQVWL